MAQQCYMHQRRASDDSLLPATSFAPFDFKAIQQQEPFRRQGENLIKELTVPPRSRRLFLDTAPREMDGTRTTPLRLTDGSAVFTDFLIQNKGQS